MKIREDSNGVPYRVGDHLRIWRSIDNLPTAATIDKAYFMVKRRYRDDDAAALVNLDVIPGGNANGEVVDIGDGNGTLPAGTGRVRFDLLPKHTRLIGARPNRFGIKVILSTGDSYTAEEDVIDLEPEIVAAES